MKTNPKSEFRGGVRMKTNPNGWLGLPEAFPRPAGGRARGRAGVGPDDFFRKCPECLPRASPGLEGPWGARGPKTGGLRPPDPWGGPGALRAWAPGPPWALGPWSHGPRIPPGPMAPGPLVPWFLGPWIPWTPGPPMGPWVLGGPPLVPWFLGPGSHGPPGPPGPLVPWAPGSPWSHGPPGPWSHGPWVPPGPRALGPQGPDTTRCP